MDEAVRGTNEENETERSRDARAPRAPAPGAHGPAPEEQVPGYRLVALLGEGSVGRVFEAQRTRDGAEVAVKVLRERHAQKPELRERFARELKAARAVEHPGAVRILDSGESVAGRPFIAMERLQGEPIGRALTRPGLTPREASGLLGSLLAVLQEAHGAGVVHRDLKSDNVVVSYAGDAAPRVVVCDFGVAKLLSPEPGTALTLEGMVCGTPEYMAPEQARGAAVDGRADLYAVGVLLYLALCGRVPFEGATPIAVIARQASEPVTPPRLRAPSFPTPRELEAVCLRALEKDPAARYQSAADMAEALRSAVATLGGQADEPLGSPVFRSASLPPSGAQAERPSIPGALPTRARVLFGSLALAAAAATVWLAWPEATAPGPAGRASGPPGPWLPVSEVEAPEDAPGQPAEASPARPATEAERALEEGKRRLRANDLAGALTSLERARALDGETPAVHRALGEVHRALGETDRALSHLRAYLKARPDARDRALVERWAAELEGR